MAWNMMDQMAAMNTVASNFAQWMQQTGVKEMSVHVEALGERVLFNTRALYQGQWYDNEVPALLVRNAIDLRPAMAQPGGGAWTKADLRMSESDYRLVTDFNYDEKPTLDPPMTREDCAVELRLYPRSPETTPEWLHA